MMVHGDARATRTLNSSQLWFCTKALWTWLLSFKEHSFFKLSWKQNINECDGVQHHQNANDRIREKTYMHLKWISHVVLRGPWRKRTQLCPIAHSATVGAIMGTLRYQAPILLSHCQPEGLKSSATFLRLCDTRSPPPPPLLPSCLSLSEWSIPLRSQHAAEQHREPMSSRLPHILHDNQWSMTNDGTQAKGIKNNPSITCQAVNTFSTRLPSLIPSAPLHCLTLQFRSFYLLKPLKNIFFFNKEWRSGHMKNSDFPLGDASRWQDASTQVKRFQL